MQLGTYTKTHITPCERTHTFLNTHKYKNKVNSKITIEYLYYP